VGGIENTSPKKPKPILPNLSNDSLGYLNNLGTQSVVTRYENPNPNGIDKKSNSKTNSKLLDTIVSPKTASMKEMGNIKNRLSEILKTEIDDIPVAELSHSRNLLEIVE